MDLGEVVTEKTEAAELGAAGAKSRWIVEPGKSRKLDRWDRFIALLLCYVAIITPFEVSFLDTKLNWMFFINRFIDVSFLLDMVVQFFVAYIDIDTGAFEYRFRPIAQRYLKSWFFIDLASILPFDTLGLAYGGVFTELKLLRVIRFMRLLKLIKIFAGQERLLIWIAKLGFSNASMELGKMCFGVLLTAHWFACTWHLAAGFAPNAQNWVEIYGYANSSMFGTYIAAYYWAIYSMVTIGYGDMGATNVGERLTATFTMMIGGAIYSYIVGSVCGIVESSGRGTTDYHQAMDILNRYMEEEHVPHRTRLHLRVYFSQCRALHMDKYNMEVLDFMSPGLQRDLAGHLHGSWMGNIAFFTTNTDRDHEFMTAVALQMMTLALPSQELLIRTGESATSLYIVRRGLVGCHGRVYRKGKYLGDDMIMGAQVKRPYRALCLTFVDVMVLTHGALIDVLDQGFYAHKTRIKSAAAWLSIRTSFLRVGKLMLNIGRMAGPLPEFDNPNDTLLFVRRLMEYDTSALLPEQLGKKQLPKSGPEYMAKLLARQLPSSSDNAHKSLKKGLAKAGEMMQMRVEEIIQRRFLQIQDETISSIHSEINTIAIFTTFVVCVCMVVGIIIASARAEEEALEEAKMAASAARTAARFLVA